MRIVVVGGAGAMGRVAVDDLAADPGVALVTVADADGVRAREVAEAAAGQGGKVRDIEADVRDPAFPGLLAGHHVCLNAASYRLNLTVMEASLAAGCHYLDLGGLFHVTRRSLELSPRFEAAGLTGVVGVGGGPGMTNLMAVLGARELGAVRAVHVRMGSRDPSVAGSPLPVPYSLDTILDEFSHPAMAWRDGDFVEVPPLGEPEDVDFPPPVGRMTAVTTLHSEVATLPAHFADRGIREVTFKIAFDPAFVERFRLLAAIGLAGEDPVEVAGVSGGTVRPRDVLAALARRFPPAAGTDDHEALRVVLEGERDGAPSRVVVDCVVDPDPARGMGAGARDTGIPPSIVAQMLARGEIDRPGVHAPEDVVPLDAFLARLHERGIAVRATRSRAGRRGEMEGVEG